jgi:hypothetical protein
LAGLVGVPRTIDFFSAALAAVCGDNAELQLASLYDVLIIADKAYNQLFGARMQAGTSSHGQLFFRICFPPELALPDRAPKFAADETEAEAGGQIAPPVCATLYPSTGRSDYPVCFPTDEKDD